MESSLSLLFMMSGDNQPKSNSTIVMLMMNVMELSAAALRIGVAEAHFRPNELFKL